MDRVGRVRGVGHRDSPPFRALLVSILEETCQDMSNDLDDMIVSTIQHSVRRLAIVQIRRRPTEKTACGLCVSPIEVRELSKSLGEALNEQDTYQFTLVNSQPLLSERNLCTRIRKI